MGYFFEVLLKSVESQLNVLRGGSNGLQLRPGGTRGGEHYVAR